MKKILYTFILLMISIGVVNAEKKFYSEEDLLNNEDIVFISREEKVIFTTTATDKNGNVLATYYDEIPPTDDENIEIARQKVEEKYNMLATPNVWGPQVSYSTDSKYLAMNYFRTSDDPANIYRIQLMLSWKIVPVVKSFDVMAIRWTNGTLSSAVGYQFSNVGTTEYSYKGTNMKIASNGVGISMNLYDKATRWDLTLEAKVYMTNPGAVYGTYQHARNSNLSTLAQSQSYTFSANGLGQVLYYSNATIRGYYDGMQGVVIKNPI